MNINIVVNGHNYTVESDHASGVIRVYDNTGYRIADAQYDDHAECLYYDYYEPDCGNMDMGGASMDLYDKTPQEDMINSDKRTHMYGLLEQRHTLDIEIAVIERTLRQMKRRRARLSNLQIAKLVGVSRQVVNYHANKLGGDL